MPLKREVIYIDGKDETDRITSYFYRGDKCVIVFKNSNKEFSYNKNRAKIISTAVSNDNAYDVFNYLQAVAATVGLKTESGDNILYNTFSSITHISEDTPLANFLNARLPANQTNSSQLLFPFGFNLSQKSAVHKAFSNTLSIIEGPPGTGKTQTILNIIANAVLNGQSVAVVSSNNSATRNVYEKLEKNGIGFISALLGNTQNKKEFIEGQQEIPELSQYYLTDTQKAEARQKATLLSDQIITNLHRKNELAILKWKKDNLKTEFQHFQNANPELFGSTFTLRQNINSEKILALWLSLEYNAKKQKKIGFIGRLINRFKYGIKDKTFYKYPLSDLIRICQMKYYRTKMNELTSKITSIENILLDFSFDAKMNEYAELSMNLLKTELLKKYHKKERRAYSVSELQHRSKEFISDYPVIMSTTYSLRRSLSENISYDFLIIDESSQVDIVTGALALSGAKRAVIVGDIQQLPNVVNTDTQIKTDKIFEEYKLADPYRYSNHSLLSSLMELLPDIPSTLLKEHYRCHPKIIDFCNQKFYNNQLVIHSPYTSDRQPLVVYKTVPGNHARERKNQRQIDIIKEEIIHNENLYNVDLGIVTPYRNQTTALQDAFLGSSIKADTVDKFQGRENKVIILSTVDNEISAFTDNPNRLNVAVSRAQEQLILVVNRNDTIKDGNIKDLIQYIEYNNFTIVQSELNSIFDLLYKDYEDARTKMIKRWGNVSEFDSENLLNGVIQEILLEKQFRKYDVVLHSPLNNLIKDYTKLNEQEIKYAQNPLTHLDFLIYNRLGKKPILAVEVDGYEFHKKGSKQSQRDHMKDSILNKLNFPFLRFSTTGSNEKERLINMLYQIEMSDNNSYDNR